MSVNTTDPMIGRLIDGRYQVRSRIARGGMATVYLATDLRLERRVAVKVMHGHLADDSSFKERFIQEARSAARLAHPNVVNVFDQGQDADSAYLVMEYLPGITLRDLLQEYGTLTSEQTIDITEAVLSGLAAAHKAGIVHRDLKPENVLLADDGRIKIGDFGLARAASANTATGAALLGTIAYLSPELVTRGVADTRSDIYAVGIMMYEMLAGEQPFKGEQPMQIAYQHAHDAVPTPSTKNPKVPAELDELVLWATTRDPEQRPRDASAMLEQLRETEALLKTALPAGATAAQRTVVMPAAPEAPRHTTAETQILTRRGAVAPAAVGLVGHEVSDSTAALSIASTKRRGRGRVLIAIILVLAVLAGGAGWYFGLGPGSKVTIPVSIAGLSPDDATAALIDLGLTVSAENGTASSPTVPIDAVAETDPALGSSVTRGGEVTLLISTGPADLPFTILQGMSQADAEAAIAAAPWTAKEPILRFDPTIPAESVIDVLADDDATSLIGAAIYGELKSLTLVISAGPLPDVANKPLDQAIAELGNVSVTATAGSEDFSDTVAAGNVIAIEGGSEAVIPNSSVTLQISKGRPPAQIPDVVGMVWSKAEKALTDAGFAIAFKNGISEGLAKGFPNAAVVSAISPPGGTTVLKGDTVTVTIQAGG